jgi:hypothetical protein
MIDCWETRPAGIRTEVFLSQLGTYISEAYMSNLKSGIIFISGDPAQLQGGGTPFLIIINYPVISRSSLHAPFKE